MDIKRFSRRKKDKEDKPRDAKAKDKLSKKERKPGSVTDIVAGFEDAEKANQPKGFFSFGSKRAERRKHEVEPVQGRPEAPSTANGFSTPQYTNEADGHNKPTQQPPLEDDSYRRSLEDRERRYELHRRNSARSRTPKLTAGTDQHTDHHRTAQEVPPSVRGNMQYQQTSPIIIPHSQVGQQIGLTFNPASNSAQITLGKQEVVETVSQAEMNAEFAPAEDFPLESSSLLDEMQLALPELMPMQTAGVRELIIRRRPAGDFGFALRRSPAEGNRAGAIHIVEPVGDEISSGLLPGDRLIEVNGKNVESATHEAIIDAIARSGDAVSLKVVPMPELAELSSRSIMEPNNNTLGASNKGVTLVRSGSRRMKRNKTKSDEELMSERAWLEAEKVWVIHSSGFSSGRLLKDIQLADDRAICKVKVDQTGDIIEVNEDLIEKANPPQYDRAEDLASLRHLNETGCLHTLRQRHGSNLIHTYAGPDLIIINPKSELGIYTDKVIQMFRGCKQEDMPPHIYAYAQTAYRSMLATRMDQSIVFLGKSGSGKSMNFRHALHYLTTAAVSPHSSLTAQKVEAALCMLESFGSAKTSLCRSASRYALMTTVEYDPSGLVVGGMMQTYLLEKSRVVHRPFGESNFKIFYELIAGSDDRLRKELHIDALWKEPNNNFINIRDVDKDYPHLSDKWLELQFALEALDINAEETKGLWAPLAAVLHLGAAGIAVDASGENFYFANPFAAQLAASVLGTSEEELARVIFAPGLSSTKVRGVERGRSSSAASVRSGEGVAGSPSSGSESVGLGPSVETYQNALEGFVMGLYVEAFTALVRLINRSINTTARIQSSLYLLDTPGFQDPASVLPKSTGASFEDLCYNYACERLNWYLHFSTFTAQIERYDRENIDCNFEMEDIVHPDVIISVLDRLNVDRRVSGQDRVDSKGIFWILEDESMRSLASAESIVDKITAIHVSGKGDAIVKAGPTADTFRLFHCQSSREVLYSTRDWLYKVKEHPTVKMAYTVLAESNKPYVADVYVGHRSGVLQVEISRTRIRKRSGHGPPLPAVKKNSVCMQVKIQMDSLLEQLRRTGTRFVHSFLPDNTAGTYDPATQSPLKQSTPLSVPLLRQQFRSANLLEGMRIYRQGYPEYVAFGEFRRRFDILLPREEREKEPVLDEKQAVQRMLEKLDLDKRSYKLGLSQIFLRAGSFAQLEDSRDDKLNDTMVQFQAHCKGLIGRRRLKTRKVQFRAVTCIQRNVRKFMAVKNWPWWRLYVKVLPLLDVHRTEEELKSKTSEADALKSKVDRLEEENKELKEMNAKLQKKVTEMSATLSEVQSSSNGAQELLDHETSERLRLEEELESVRNEYNKLMKQNEKLETELLEARIARPVRSSRDRLDDADDYSSDEDSIYKSKYIAITREFEVLRKKLNDQSEEEIQQLQDAKRHVERQLAEEKEESEDLRRSLTNTKRKLARLNGEMEDMKLILETSQGRNAELEKKQRKFDQDMNALRDSLNDEKASREAVQRDRDRLQAEKYQLEADWQDKEEEISRLKRQVERLDNELQDISQLGKTDGNELMNIKKDKRELEMKVQEQEEELDEQAGRILMLEQSKLKVEMESQKDKQKFQKDLEARDEEVERLRTDYQRKVRQVEEQIEEEQREKSEAVKVRRDLERRVFELQRCADESDHRSEKKLRKELKKLRSLYKDAKYALENQALQATDKNAMKQLRNQLEDAEFAKHIAVKSKKQLEVDLMELQKKLEEMTDARQDAEERILMLSRDNSELLSKIEEDDDDASDVIKKNRTLVAQIETLQAHQVQDKAAYNQLREEKESLDDQVRQLSNKVRFLEENMVDKVDVERAEAKIRDLEHKLEIEVSAKIRLENQSTRLKGNIERLQEDKDLALSRESRSKQELIRLERQLKEQRDFAEVLQKQETEHKRRREEAEAQVENLDQTVATLKVDLTHANKRIRDLQEAMEREMLSSDDDDVVLDDDDSEDELTIKRRVTSPNVGSLTRSVKSYGSPSPRGREVDSSSRLERKLSALEDEVRSSRTRLSRSYDSLDEDPGYYSRHKGYRKDSASSNTPSIPESDSSLRRSGSIRSSEGLLSYR